MKTENSYAENYQSNSRSEDTSDIENKYLTFTLSDSTYAVDINYVVQIIGIQKITALPNMGSAMKGVINLRGMILPIFSFSNIIGKPETEYTTRSCIIILQMSGETVGMIVDSIDEAVDIDPSVISPTTATNDAPALVTCVAQLSEGKMVLFLSTEELLRSICDAG